MNKPNPSITVVTIVLNNELHIEATIKSVLHQKYTNIQYVVIDGLSSDNTLNLIKKYGEKIDVLISEEDSGIYDAMNKGIKLAKGDWVIFMNAGDIFFNEDVLKKVAKQLEGDVVYGNHAIYRDRIDSYEFVSVEGYSDKRNIPFCHQSVFIKRDLLKQNLFDLRYKIAADYDQYLKIKSSGALVKYIPTTISKILDGGLSSRSRFIIIREYFDITKNYWPIYAHLMYFFRFIKYLATNK